VQGSIAVWQLGRSGLLERTPTPTLSRAGVIHATKLLRAHRLWEAWLAKEGSLPSDHLHDPSERMEHFIEEALAEKLGAEVGTEIDPQGREIPRP
jgi:Mn-dependent DtxR family transcriptional regulator